MTRRRTVAFAVALFLIVAASPTMSGAREASAATSPISPASAGEITSTQDGGGCVANKNGVNPPVNSTNEVQYTTCNGEFGHQLWTLEPNSTIRMTFDFQNASSGYNGSHAGAYQCLQAGTGNQVDLTYCNGSAAQDWTTALVSGTSNLYTLKVNGAGCLQAPGALNDQLVVASCVAGRSSQQWVLPDNTQAVNQEAAQVLNLMSSWDSVSALFADGKSSNPICVTAPRDNYITGQTAAEYGGNCWWWSANAMSTLTDFLLNPSVTPARGSNASGWVGVAAVYQIIQQTYNRLCPTGACPNMKMSAQDHNKENPFQNDWFDDTANWALSWLDAYEYSEWLGTPQDEYLFLAENLWRYITRYGWNNGVNPLTGNSNGTGKFSDGTKCLGGIIQSYTSASTTWSLGVNGLYLRLSSDLYLATRNNTNYRDTSFRDGISDGSSNGPYGGYVNEANWLFPGTNDTLFFPSSVTVNGTTTDFPDYTPLIMYGQPDMSSCSGSRSGNPQVQHQAMMIGGLAALYDAGSVSAGGGASGDELGQVPSYYLTAADNMAQTDLTNTSADSYPSPPMTEKDPAGNAVLNESGDPSNGEPAGDSPYLPGKGIYLRNLYCLSQEPVEISDLPDVATFIGNNAASVLANAQSLDVNPGDQALNLNKFGYWWQGDPNSPGSVGLMNDATQFSGVDAITADLNLAQSPPPTTMC